MHLSKPENCIAYAMKMANRYYNKETLDHALRVALFVSSNNIIPKEIIDNCIALAIMHDLREDTDWRGDGFSDHFSRCIDLITRDKNNQTYEEYIRNISDYKGAYPEVYFVKLADIKDHLTQKDTLPDSLKERYIEALKILV